EVQPGWSLCSESSTLSFSDSDEYSQNAVSILVSRILSPGSSAGGCARSGSAGESGAIAAAAAFSEFSRIGTFVFGATCPSMADSAPMPGILIRGLLSIIHCSCALPREESQSSQRTAEGNAWEE